MQRFFRLYGMHVYWVVAFADIAAVQWQYQPLIMIAKPLLMPLLLGVLSISVTSFSKKILVLAGLFFSFAGDVFLLFDSQNPLFFMVGLVCFLITHALYITFFLNIRSAAPSLLKRRPVLVSLVFTYVILLLWILVPKLNNLKIPVIVYAFVLGTMLLSSLQVWYKAEAPAGKLFVAGAVLFVLSDSLLAITKFYMPLPFAGVAIMATYCAAQYLIVRGVISQKA